MARKAIRLQIDLLYHVDDSLAQGLYENDVAHFNEMGQLFNKWALDKKEPREPINFDFRHHLGEVVEE